MMTSSGTGKLRCRVRTNWCSSTEVVMGSWLLCQDLSEVLNGAKVVVMASRGIKRELQRYLRPEYFVFDLVNLEKSKRPDLSNQL